MKSSFSGKQANCIDVQAPNYDSNVMWDDHIKVSETENLTVMFTTQENFTAFVRGVKAGEFDGYCTREYLMSGE